MNFSLLHNTPFALLVWYVREGHEDEAKVFPGLATWHAATQTVEVRNKQSGDVMVTLEGEQLDRIMEVTEDLKETLCQCDYGISLTMGDLSDENSDRLEKLAIQW